MKHKNISTQSSELLSYFNGLDQLCFSGSEALNALPNSSKNAMNQLLSDMTKRGLLMRIKESVYYIIPYEQDPKLFMPEWHLLAGCLIKSCEYYVGYYSALEVHNLITQPSLKEQIVVNKQIKPSTIHVKNIPFQFIYHNPKHFFGAKNMWIDNFNKVKCSDLEKTFIDCLFKPNYAGGIVEIARAVYISKDNINFNKLYKYTAQFNSQAVVKRLGYLLELLEIDNPIIKKLQQKKTASYVLLDTELPKKGSYLSKWSVQLNIDSETIKSAMYT